MKVISENLSDREGPRDRRPCPHLDPQPRAGLDAQVRDLETLGCERTFQEQVFSIGPLKPLDAALDFVRTGDVLVVAKLDRLARPVTHLGTIVAELEKGVPCVS